MNDGKAVYDNRVNFIWLMVGIANTPASARGSLTLKDGSYTYGTMNEWSNRRQGSGTRVAEAECRFELKIEKKGASSAGSAEPANAQGENLVF